MLAAGVCIFSLPVPVFPGRNWVTGKVGVGAGRQGGGLCLLPWRGGQGGGTAGALETTTGACAFIDQREKRVAVGDTITSAGDASRAP